MDRSIENERTKNKRKREERVRVTQVEKPHRRESSPPLAVLSGNAAIMEGGARGIVSVSDVPSPIGPLDSSTARKLHSRMERARGTSPVRGIGGGET